jgi:hypothetical protein
VYMPCSQTPVDLRAGPVRVFALQHLGVAFRQCNGVGSNDDISGLHHTAYTLAVYASQPGSTSGPRKTRFRLVASLVRAGYVRHTPRWDPL